MAHQYLLTESWPWLVGIFTTLYMIYGAIWRLFWSPLAKFPGPPLAALTLWYEFYYDVVKKGRYMWEIEKMHEKYGSFHLLRLYWQNVE